MVGYHMKRAQHALRIEMDEALREVGMTTAQYAALSTLEAATGLSAAELARGSSVTLPDDERDPDEPEGHRARRAPSSPEARGRASRFA